MRIQSLLVSLWWESAAAWVSTRPLERPWTELSAIRVALTRELGKNDKLQRALGEFEGAIETVELPCIAHADGEDYVKLAEEVQNDYDYIAVTSPEAARVLASAVSDPANLPPIAAVGKVTEETLNELGMTVAFVPSRALASVLVEELPGESGCRLLYPASAKAKDTLEAGLRERGFAVTRLNTYDTVVAEWDQQQKEAAAAIGIACFASPSSVKGWLSNTDSRRDVLAACIGETSAKACRKEGWKEEQIFYPDKPGIEGWVEAVQDAVQSISTVHTSN